MAKPPFQPEYVTEREPHDDAAPIEPFDYDTEIALARDRLYAQVAQQRNYPGRDRDLLLLRLLDESDRLDERLTVIKRTLDVLVTRTR